MSKYCPKCGKEHLNNEEYCLDCNTPLNSEKEEELLKESIKEKNPTTENETISPIEEELLKEIIKEKTQSTDETKSHTAEDTLKELKNENNEETKTTSPIEEIEDKPTLKSKPSKPNTNLKTKHKKFKRLTPHHKFLKVNKKASTILIVLLTIAIVSTIAYEVTLYNNSNYLKETSPGSLEFSNKIVQFKLPNTWTEITNNGKNIIGSYQNVKNGSDTILSVYESPASNKNINDIINSSINLDKKSGTTSNDYNLIDIDGVQAYDLISTNGTDGYNYRTIGFITNGKEYSFMFVSKSSDMNNSDITNIINSIRI